MHGLCARQSFKVWESIWKEIAKNERAADGHCCQGRVVIVLEQVFRALTADKSTWLGFLEMVGQLIVVTISADPHWTWDRQDQTAPTIIDGMADNSS